MKYNPTDLKRIYESPETTSAAFDAVVAGFKTDTATSPEVPVVELSTSADRVADRQANIGGRIASALFTVNMNPEAVRFFTDMEGERRGIPAEAVDAAVAVGLLSLST